MEIKVIPDEQTPCIPEMGDVSEFIKSNKQLLDSFLSFAESRSDAIGLAANQISIDGERFMHRVFALCNLKDRSWRLIINPVIDEYIGIKELKNEGCLTWVGRRIISERSRAVKVSYYDINGNKTEGEFYKGFISQVWQHELNHLNGIEERIERFGFKLPHQKDFERNKPCPCSSGKKYKQCCLLLI